MKPSCKEVCQLCQKDNSIHVLHPLRSSSHHLDTQDCHLHFACLVRVLSRTRMLSWLHGTASPC